MCIYYTYANVEQTKSPAEKKCPSFPPFSLDPFLLKNNAFIFSSIVNQSESIYPHQSGGVGWLKRKRRENLLLFLLFYVLHIFFCAAVAPKPRGFVSWVNKERKAPCFFASWSDDVKKDKKSSREKQLFLAIRWVFFCDDEDEDDDDYMLSLLKCFVSNFFCFPQEQIIIGKPIGI